MSTASPSRHPADLDDALTDTALGGLDDDEQVLSIVAEECDRERVRRTVPSRAKPERPPSHVQREDPFRVRGVSKSSSTDGVRVREIIDRHGKRRNRLFWPRRGWRGRERNDRLRRHAAPFCDNARCGHRPGRLSNVCRRRAGTRGSRLPRDTRGRVGHACVGPFGLAARPGASARSSAQRRGRRFASTAMERARELSW
jgi:hypothetical protein